MRQPTIRDVAERSGVSIGTVSRFLNGTQVKRTNAELIKQAVEELGYKPNIAARSMVTGRTYTVGILVPSMRNVFIGELISSLGALLREQGYTALFVDYHHDVRALRESTDFLVSRNVDGIVAFLSELDASRQGFLADLDVPVVVVDNPLEDVRVDSVVVDNREAVAAAVGSMLDAGHRRVGVVSFEQDSYVGRARLAGWRDAYEQRGLIAQDADAVFSAANSADAAVAMRELLARNNITAVFACSYYLALGALRAINTSGLRAGIDIGYASFDELEFAGIAEPCLATVCQPIDEMANVIARVMLGRLSGGIDADGVHIVACEQRMTPSVAGGL